MDTNPLITSVKEQRRKRVAELLDQYGKTKLAEMLDMNPNFLWQMGKGEGTSARNVSDRTAAQIEKRLKKTAGWLDEGYATRASHKLRLDPEIISAALKLVRLTFLNLDVPYDPEEDGLPVSLAYGFLASLQEHEVTVENVIDFTKYLRREIGERDATKKQQQRS